MYESFFELNQRPFPVAPLAHRYWPGASIESARSTLARCIERASGAGLLIGASGTGKSLLCYVLAEQFKDRLALALLFSGNLTTRRDLLQAILFELGLPYRGLEEGELRLSLIDHLTRGDACPDGLLLVIDEAHTLPLKLLEEVRMITNLVRGGQPCVRLLLAGGPLLEEHFAHPKLGSFSQRLAARCYLEPLGRDETFEYVRAHVSAVGGDAGKLFAPDALQAVYRATDGIPRLINQVCDHALVLAHTTRKRQLTAGLVEAAWADLQQLPAPWGETATARQASASHGATSVIEFGSLHDEVEVGSSELRLTLPPDDLDDVSAWRTVPSLPIGGASHADGQSIVEDETGSTEVDLFFDEPAAEETVVEQPVVAAAAVPEEAAPEELVTADYIEHVAMAPWGSEAIEPRAILPPMFDPLAAPPLAAGPAIYPQPSYEASTLEPLDGPALERTWLAREAAARQRRLEVEMLAADNEFHITLPIDETAIIELTPDAAATVETVDLLPALPELPRPAADDAVEEVLFDHYGALDAMKVQGKLPARGAKRPAAKPRQTESYEPIRTPATISYSAEKTLSLAEALLRQALSAEQTAGVFDAPFDKHMEATADSLFGLSSVPGGDEVLKETWSSVDLLPPAMHDVPTVPANVPRATFTGTGAASVYEQCPDRLTLPAGELELIVVEDDPPERVAQSPPTAAPVKRQEYRQLFARLRKS